MKTTIIKGLYTAICFAFMSACQVGVHKDLNTGLKYSYNVLGVDDVILSIGDEQCTNKEFPLESQVYMSFLGVDGFNDVDGKVYPGLSVKVTNPDHQEIINAADLFAQYDAEGLSPEMASELSSNITIGNPMQSGEQYHWHIAIWDKKGNGIIEAEMDFTVIN